MEQHRQVAASIWLSWTVCQPMPSAVRIVLHSCATRTPRSHRWHERAGPASSTLQQQPVHVPVVPTALPQLPPVKTRAPQGTPRVAAAPRDLVPLSHVHAVLPGMLLQVVHMASQRGYPKDVIDFMHNCMVASTPNLIQYLDNALQPSIRCVQQQCDDSKRCSRPYSSATPRGGETPVQPRAAVLKHSSTLARSVSGSPGLIGTTLTPTRGIPQASSWGVGEDGQPRLVRMTVGQLLHGQQLVERLDDDHC